MTLPDLCLATHYELRHAFGRREIVLAETYEQLPEEAVRHVIAVPLTRRDMIRRRMARRRSVRS